MSVVNWMGLVCCVVAGGLAAQYDWPIVCIILLAQAGIALLAR